MAEPTLNVPDVVHLLTGETEFVFIGDSLEEKIYCTHDKQMNLNLPYLLQQYSKTCLNMLRGHSDEGTPVIRGHFLRMVSYLPHVKEPVMKGHL